MRSDDAFAYQEQERDSDLIGRHFARASDLKSAAARHHLIGGFNRRVLMLATSRRVIEEITHSPRDHPIGVYRAIDLGIQLNAYYLNLCGALDNLAWAMQYEWNVFPDVTETTRGFSKVGLFAPKFFAALRRQRSEIATDLEAFSEWNKDLRSLRDPAAHRVPLYAIPGYLTDTDLPEIRRLDELVTERAARGDHHRMMEAVHERSLLGRYEPLMSVWTPDGERFVDAWQTIVHDHHQFQLVSQLISAALIPAQQ